MSNFKTYINENKDRFLKQLREYIAIKSISPKEEFETDVDEAADWVAAKLSDVGLENVKKIPTKGNAVVYGDWLNAEDAPTVLFYGHYDVMPPGDEAKWKTKPFEMVIEEDTLFGRGVADNKGPHFSHIVGIQSILATEGKLSVNVKFLLEGEEEKGSPNILQALEKNIFDCDVVFVSDGQMEYDYPVIEYGLRGLVYLEIEVKCLKKDVHSGSYGGVVDNPAIVLSRIISKLKNKKGKITIPGFYENVRKLSDEERHILKKVEKGDEQICKNTGAKKVHGEDGFLNIERIGSRPTFDINGLWGGYTQKGSMTIIPEKATAKISMRIVPNQTHEEVENLVRNYIKQIKTDTCEVSIKSLHGGDPVLFDWKSKQFKAARNALGKVFGKEARYKLVGGSIGAVVAMKKALGVDSVLTGFSLPDCNMHGPNENLKLENFLRGVEVTKTYLEELARK